MKDELRLRIGDRGAGPIRPATERELKEIDRQIDEVGIEEFGRRVKKRLCRGFEIDGRMLTNTEGYALIRATRRERAAVRCCGRFNDEKVQLTGMCPLGGHCPAVADIVKKTATGD